MVDLNVHRHAYIPFWYLSIGSYFPSDRILRVYVILVTLYCACGISMNLIVVHVLYIVQDIGLFWDILESSISFIYGFYLEI